MDSGRRLALLLPTLAGLSLCYLLALAAGRGDSSPGPQQLESYHYSQDFASGEAAGWTSYPPVQDVAYDPSLTPVRHGDGYALARLLRPTRSGLLEIGFIRRMFFVASPALRLSFTLSLEPCGPPDGVEVGLATRRGVLYRASAKPGAVRLTGADFGLKTSEEVEAVYVLARVGQASPSVEYTLRLDDVRLEAQRAPRWKFTQPALVESRGWEMRVASRVYRQGEELRVEPAASGLRLLGPAGALRAATGPFTAADPPGLWRAELANGSSFAFLLAARQPAGHPRLADLAELRRRAVLPDFAEAWKQVQERAARSRREQSPPPWAGENLLRLYTDQLLPGLLTYFSLLDRTGDLVLTNALVHAVEGNPEAREAARKALLAAAAWPTWTPPWFPARGMHTYYETGLFTRALALGYDLLAPELNESERRAVRRALRDLAILPTFREHFLDARMPFPTSNWIGNSLAGALVALAVIDGEEPDPELASALSGLVARLRAHVDETILPDGSSGEPLGYQNFDLEGAGWAMAALERVYGIDFRLGTALDRAHHYALYAAIGKNQFPDMGDGGLGATHGFAWLAAHSDDARLRKLYWSLPRDQVGQLLLAPPPGGGKDEPLASSRFFPQKGAAILRSGWDPEATVFIYRAGPNFNHNHIDAGGFYLAARGQLLLSEAGVSHYYNDPHYQSHFVQAIGHNVMLVDGDPESQFMPDFLPIQALDRRPRWKTTLAAEAADLLRTDLQPLYKAPLAGYERAVVFVKPDYLVLCDRVAAPAQHVFSWLFHAPAADDARLRLAGSAFSIERPGISLWAQLAGDWRLELRQQDWPTPLGAFGDLMKTRIPVRHYVEASTPRAYRATLVALLYPLAPGRVPPHVEQLSSPNAFGLRVDGRDEVVFRTGPGAIQAAQIRADADSVFLRVSADGIEKMIVDSGTAVIWRSRELLSSPQPITLAVSWGPGGAQGTARTSSATSFQLAAFGGSSPTLRVSVPAGESVFSAPYR